MCSHIDSEERRETKELQRIVKDAHETEKKKAFDAGVPVSVIRGQQLIELLPDGSERILKTYTKPLFVTIDAKHLKSVRLVN